MSFTPKNALVWAEIPVSDLNKAIAFYSAVFGYEMKVDESGPNPIAFLPMDMASPGAGGHLYPGTPAGNGDGPTVHLAVPDTVEATAGRVRDAGGQANDTVMEIPAGRFGYATDPDGNSLGLFQRPA
ncbi:MAG: VOC family protein [Rhodobacter sp.]|nr:VOC family protein [Rhodobacter sp.]